MGSSPTGRAARRMATTQQAQGRHCGMAALRLACCADRLQRPDRPVRLSQQRQAVSLGQRALHLPASPARRPGGSTCQCGCRRYAGLDNTEAALAAARPSSGIEKVSLKNAQGVAVTVDDLPITNFDISQRINLENALGGRVSTDFATRKRILGTLVNEKVAKTQANKLGFNLSTTQIDERIDGMTKRMKLSRADLRKRLSEKGVDESTLKAQIEGSIYIRWVMQQQKVDTDIKVDQAKVDAKIAEIMSDPRMKPLTVISVQQVDLPVENPKSAMGQQLMYARAVEAQQIMQRYKGCNSIKSASRDIFNVKVGRRMEADVDKLPKELRTALLKAGTKKLIGPVPGPPASSCSPTAARARSGHLPLIAARSRQPCATNSSRT
jgi:peptidyl-prolyl cis-trans isomerase SurA